MDARVEAWLKGGTREDTGDGHTRNNTGDNTGDNTRDDTGDEAGDNTRDKASADATGGAGPVVLVADLCFSSRSCLRRENHRVGYRRRRAAVDYGVRFNY